MATKRNKGLQVSSALVYDVPFVGLNTVRSMAGQRAVFVAVLDVGDGFLCIEHQLGLNHVVLFAAKKSNFPHFFSRTQDDLSEVTADLKSKALISGATLEAIQLLGQLTELSKEEEAEMANPKAAASAKKLATKAAPAPKAEKKAARTPAEFDYKVVKGVENKTREGTWARHMIDTILAHTDAASARAANSKAKGETPKGQKYSDKALDFAWAKEQGYITY